MCVVAQNSFQHTGNLLALNENSKMQLYYFMLRFSFTQNKDTSMISKQKDFDHRVCSNIKILYTNKI